MEPTVEYELLMYSKPDDDKPCCRAFSSSMKMLYQLGKSVMEQNPTALLSVQQHLKPPPSFPADPYNWSWRQFCDIMEHRVQ